MEAANDGGEIAINAGDKGEACRTAEPGRSGSQNRDTFQQGEWGDDALQAGARAHDVDGLQDAGEHADLLLRHGDEHGQRGAEVDEAGNGATDEDGDGQIAARIADLIAHDGSQVKTDQAVADGAERCEEAPVVETGAQIGGMQGAAIVMQRERGEQADHGCAADGAQRAEIADPLAQREPAHIQGEQKKNNEQRCDAGEGMAVGEFLYAWSSDVNGYANAGEHNGGEIDDVRKPVTPAGKEAVLLAEAALGPEIDATLARPLLG